MGGTRVININTKLWPSMEQEAIDFQVAFWEDSELASIWLCVGMIKEEIRS